jgi:hypothetical protein
MVTSPNCDALVVENRSDIMGMHVVHDESQHAGLMLGRTDDPDSVDFGNAISRIGQELAFPGPHLLQADALEVFQRSTESGHLSDHGGAGLEFRRQRCPGRPL